MKNNVDRYISQVSRRMRCPPKHKKLILSDFRDTIYEFEDTAQLSLTELHEKFDSPRQVANNLLEEIPENVLKAFKIRSIILNVFLAAIALITCLVIAIALNEKQEYKITPIQPKWETEITKGD